MQGIGRHVGFVKRISCVNIKDHVGNLPCGLESVLGVSYNGHKLPLGADISGYGIVKTGLDYNSEPVKGPEQMELIKLIDIFEKLQDNYDNAAPADKPAIQEQMDRISKSIEGIVRSNRPASKALMVKEDYYNIDLGTIQTSFSDGKVHILHTTIPLDKEGFPIIIDEFNYKKAVEFYILWMLTSRGMKHPAYDVKDAFTMWELYRHRASNKSKMPSIDRQERFKNLWTRYRTSYDFGANFFVNAEQPAYITD
jgi:hypothetical protein